jgi:hypothetical protein
MTPSSIPPAGDRDGLSGAGASAPAAEPPGARRAFEAALAEASDGPATGADADEAGPARPKRAGLVLADAVPLAGAPPALAAAPRPGAGAAPAARSGMDAAAIAGPRTAPGGAGTALPAAPKAGAGLRAAHAGPAAPQLASLGQPPGPAGSPAASAAPPAPPRPQAFALALEKAWTASGPRPADGLRLEVLEPGLAIRGLGVTPQLDGSLSMTLFASTHLATAGSEALDRLRRRLEAKGVPVGDLSVDSTAPDWAAGGA